jgi:hypothetical protein
LLFCAYVLFSDDRAEISVHGRLEDGTCRKIDRNFGEWGLKKCVSECFEVVSLLFGNDVYKEVCNQEPMWLDEVTRKMSNKIIVDYKSDNNITLQIPILLTELYEERTSKNIKEEINFLKF